MVRFDGRVKTKKDRDLCVWCWIHYFYS